MFSHILEFQILQIKWSKLSKQHSPSSLVVALLRFEGMPLILLKNGTMNTSYSVAGRRSDSVCERVTPPEMVTTSNMLQEARV